MELGCMAASQTAHADDALFETTGPDPDETDHLDDADEDAIEEGLTQDTILQAGELVSDKLGWDGQAEDIREFRTTPESERDEEWDQTYNQMMRTVQMIGGAVIGIAVIVIVVNEVLTTNAVNNSSGPFGGVIDSLETTGVAAMTLLVVGLLVAAASKLMSFFGGGF